MKFIKYLIYIFTIIISIIIVRSIKNPYPPRFFTKLNNQFFNDIKEIKVINPNITYIVDEVNIGDIIGNTESYINKYKYYLKSELIGFSLNEYKTAPFQLIDFKNTHKNGNIRHKSISKSVAKIFYKRFITKFKNKQNLNNFRDDMPVWDIHFIDKNIGYAVARYLILKTIDGGNTWNIIHTWTIPEKLDKMLRPT